MTVNLKNLRTARFLHLCFLSSQSGKRQSQKRNKEELNHLTFAKHLMLSHLIQKLPLAGEQCTEIPGRNVKFSNTCVRK